MRSKRVLRILVSVVVVTLLAVTLFIHSLYLFNPLTFHRDNVTLYNWWHYPKSVVMEIADIDKGWKTVVVTDPDEIRQIYMELKGAPETESRSTKQLGKHFVITTRHAGTSGNVGWIDQFSGYTEGGTSINNGKEVEIGSTLKEMLERLMTE
ncbi:hypothetical protein [Paenibacillus sp. CF384]|uniref:hypothetical protein n=1 Tax=Paenibacillus sp. CF384 TaxID=1884382 RepID=UPI0008977609|nr:hypothetical protein [Paenibacillus sp. CF384]SDW23860.1 hypothetical protein SAMN05518855_1001760 [Paenibacillus sp. CF384]